MLITPLLLAGALSLELGAGAGGELALGAFTDPITAPMVDLTARFGGPCYGALSLDPLLVPKGFDPIPGMSASLGVGWRLVDDAQKTFGVGGSIIASEVPIPEIDTENFFLSVASVRTHLQTGGCFPG
jgi:hypothetical protein